jgi:hypothetical protein
MPEYQTHPPLGERFRHPPGSPARRTIVRAVVTELVPVLEPIGRDPFIDGSDDVTRRRTSPLARRRMTDLRCG